MKPSHEGARGPHGLDEAVVSDVEMGKLSHLWLKRNLIEDEISRLQSNEEKEVCDSADTKRRGGGTTHGACVGRSSRL